MAARVILSALFQDPEGERTWSIAPVAYVQAASLSTYLALAKDYADRVQACSSLALVEWGFHVKQIGELALPDRAPLASYQKAEDKAYLLFRNPADGSRFTQELPGPFPGSFLSDGETVDPTEASIAAYIQFVHDHVTHGQQSTGYVYQRGYRVRRKTRRTMRQGVPTERGG